MNQVQNTSLFMRGRLEGETDARWLEATSPGHGGDGTVFYRTFDPRGKAWHEFLDRQPGAAPEAVPRRGEHRGGRAVGLPRGQAGGLGGFFFGFVDDFVALYIFREPVFHMWMSASGGTAVRSPAWDYYVNDGPQRAAERRTFHVRLVHKPYAGLEDVMAEVGRFRQG